jgi:LEA14-like dessication related protein
MTTIGRFFGLSLAILLAGTGCAALEREAERRKPSASIDSTRVTGFDFDAARLLVDVRVDNPNPVGIEIAGLDYELRLDDERVLTGDSAERSDIPARGSGTVAVPITLDYGDLADRVGHLRGRDKVDYAIDLGIMVDVPLLGKRRLPVTASGTVPIPQRPDIALRDLRVERLSLGGARVVLDVAVSNPNAFALALNTLQYELSINSGDWASGALSELTQVGAGERSTLSVPIDLDFAAIGSGVRALLMAGARADYGLSGVLSGTAGPDLFGDFELSFDETGTIGVTR